MGPVNGRVNVTLLSSTSHVSPGETNMNTRSYFRLFSLLACVSCTLLASDASASDWRFAEEFWKDIGRLLTAVQENKTEEVINYVKTCQEKLSENTNLEVASKKLTKMVNAAKK